MKIQEHIAETWCLKTVYSLWGIRINHISSLPRWLNAVVIIIKDVGGCSSILKTKQNKKPHSEIWPVSHALFGEGFWQSPSSQ